MADLLVGSNDTFWSAKLAWMAREGWRSEWAAREEIDSFWDKMGSLSDFVLEKNGSLLVAENEEFDCDCDSVLPI